MFFEFFLHYEYKSKIRKKFIAWDVEVEIWDKIMATSGKPSYWN